MSKMTTLLFVALFTVILGSSIYITFLKDSLNSLEVENEYIIKQNERLKKHNKILVEDRDAAYRKYRGGE